MTDYAFSEQRVSVARRRAGNATDLPAARYRFATRLTFADRRVLIHTSTMAGSPQIYPTFLDRK